MISTDITRNSLYNITGSFFFVFRAAGISLETLCLNVTSIQGNYWRS